MRIRVGSAATGSARRLGRQGFTLTEALVALAMVGIVAGVVMTGMITPQENSVTGALAQNLNAVSVGVQSFRGDVGRYPSRLSYLSAPPPAGATDLCGRSIPQQQLDGWKGPYVSRRISASGIASGDATIAEALRRDPASRSSGSFGTLVIDASTVERVTATALDELFDGGDGADGGTIGWTPGGEADAANLTYRMPIRGC